MQLVLAKTEISSARHVVIATLMPGNLATSDVESLRYSHIKRRAIARLVEASHILGGRRNGPARLKELDPASMAPLSGELSADRLQQ